MYKIIPYTPEWQEKWDMFVDESANGTIFHKQKFLLYHPRDKFEDGSLLFLEDDEIISVFPAAIKDNCLWSHAGSSFGGLVFKQIGIERMLNVVDSLDEYASQQGFEKIIMVLTPNVFHQSPLEGLEFALFFRGYRAESVELSVCVDLKQDFAFSERRIRGIKKALQNGLSARKSNDFPIFWKILERNLRIRHAVKPTHSWDDISRLKALFPSEIKLFGAFRDEEMLAGLVIFINNATSFETFYIAQNYRHSKMRGLDLVIKLVYDWAKANGFRYMNFGISSEERGKKLILDWPSLKRNSGAVILYEEYIRKNYKTCVCYEPLLSADTDECMTLCSNCHKEAHSESGCRYVDLRCDIVRRIYTKEITSTNTKKNEN